MGLLVKDLELNNFRNFGHLHLELDEKITILLGHNASGKTNTIEALQLLTLGESFRKPTPKQLILAGQERGRAAVQLSGDGRLIDVALDISAGRKRFSRQNKTIVASDVAGTLLSVLFNPDDLALVKQGASQRRGEIDSFGVQANATYKSMKAQYERVLEQRNRFLKEEGLDASLLAAWDESLAYAGATLLRARLNLMGKLSPLITEIYADIAESEELVVRYESSFDEAGDISEASRDELQELFVQNLRAHQETDMRLGQTTVGPHRDDIKFYINAQDARYFGSQGQQRSVVLALKMAEVMLAERLLGERPLLLLDDVMSELDERRRAALTQFVDGSIQTVISTTNVGYFDASILDHAKVIEYGQA